MRGRLDRLRTRRADERGFVLVTAVIVMALLLIVVTAAVIASSSASETAGLEAFQTQALAAAQSGLRMAVYETNGLGLDVASVVNPNSLRGDLLPGQCAVQSGTQLSAIGQLSNSGVSASFNGNGSLNIGGSWCAPVRASIGNGESYCYQLSPLVIVNATTNAIVTPNSLNLSGSSLSLKLTREVVASGTAGGITRWAYETLQDPVSTNLPNLLQLLAGTSSLNVRLYAPLSGTYAEGRPATQPTGGFSCP